MAIRVRHMMRRVVPFPIRLALVRWQQTRAWKDEASSFHLDKSTKNEHPFLIADHKSPLRREGTTYAESLQIAKETNVSRAAWLIDGIIVPPGAVFSYHHAVGPPLRSRGFVKGPELQNGELQLGVGGGCCQVSNLLYVVALLAGMEIVERHRHGLDLFPDSGRTVPFGCGATVYFPSSDLRFRNPFEQSIRIGLALEEGYLVGRILSHEPLGKRFEIFEIETNMRREGEIWIRENRVGRRRIDGDGHVEAIEEVAHNVARCMYEPITPEAS